jgi:YidC/Oxa1 family membrane protein insertase
MFIWSILLDAVRGALFALSHVFGGSLGMGIIGLSVILRLALLPWGVKAARRSLAMRESLKALEPRLREIRTRYAGDPVKLRDQMVAEYRKAGVNPLRDSGFVLLLLQVPLGWAVYTVVRTGVGAGEAFLWIADLARPDIAISLVTGVLSVIMGLTMTATGGPVSPTAMSLVFGAASFLVVFHLSAGIALYWASTSSVAILQNVLVRRSAAAAA